MRLREFTNRRYYHATWAKAVSKIKKNGLTVGNKSNWALRSGSKIDKAIYLFNTFAGAVRWAHKMSWDSEDDAVILCIDAPEGLDADDNSEVHSMGGGFKSFEDIPPEGIVGEVPLTLELTRKFVKDGDLEAPC